MRDYCVIIECENNLWQDSSMKNVLLKARKSMKTCCNIDCNNYKYNNNNWKSCKFAHEEFIYIWHL